MVRPSALTVLRLTKSSNLVGCMTGRSSRFFALEDAAYIDAGLAKTVRLVGAVAHE